MPLIMVGDGGRNQTRTMQAELYLPHVRYGRRSHASRKIVRWFTLERLRKAGAGTPSIGGEEAPDLSRGELCRHEGDG